jgi:hypothetical protein
MLRHEALVRTDVTEEIIASIIKETNIIELQTSQDASFASYYSMFFLARRFLSP